MYPSLLLLIRFFGFGVFSIGFFLLLPHGGGTTGCNSCGVAYVCGGGLQLYLENKAEEGLCIPLYLFISKFLVDPRHHNNLIRQPGCLRWAFFFNS